MKSISQFHQWMQQAGIWLDTSKIAIVPDPTMEKSVCIQATCDLDENDIVAKIPKSAILSPITSEFWRIVQESPLDFSDPVALTMTVMYEQFLGKDSFWFGYLSSLNCDYNPNIPLFWLKKSRALLQSESDECSQRIMADYPTIDMENESLEVQLIEGTDIEDAVDVLDSLWLGFDEKAKPVLKKAAIGKNVYLNYDLSFRHFLKTMSLVLSRCFGVDSYHRDCLVPLADLFNHKTNAEHVHLESEEPDFSEKDEKEKDVTSMEDDDSGDVIDMRIIRKVGKGMEVFNTYGTLSSTHLLIGYGFTEKEENPFDFVNVDFDIVQKGLRDWFESQTGRHKKRRKTTVVDDWFNQRLRFWNETGRAFIEEQEEEEEEEEEENASEPDDNSSDNDDNEDQKHEDHDDEDHDDEGHEHEDHDDEEEEEEEDTNYMFLKFHFDGNADPRFLAFLGVFLLPEQDFVEHQDSDEADFWHSYLKNCTQIDSFDIVSKKDVINVILDIVMHRQEKMNKISAEGSASLNVMNALRIRDKERALLAKTVDLFIKRRESQQK